MKKKRDARTSKSNSTNNPSIRSVSSRNQDADRYDSISYVIRVVHGEFKTHLFANTYHRDINGPFRILV